MAATCTIALSNNGAWSKNFVYQDGSGVAIPLTGVALKMAVRRRVGDPSVFMNLSTASGGITITDAVNGKFRIDISEAQLSRLAAGTYVHDLVPTVGGLDGQPIWSGTMIVQQGITP